MSDEYSRSVADYYGALGIAGSVEALEAELARPVVSVNVATYWHGLRTLGIRDKLAGFGQLAQMSWDPWRSRSLAPMQR